MIVWNVNTLVLMTPTRFIQRRRFSYFESIDSSFLKETNTKQCSTKRRGRLVVHFICISLPILYRFRRKVFGSEIIDRQVRKEFSLAAQCGLA